MVKKTDAPLPYYKWYWQDWRSNRAVQRMSYIERGLYRELLDECWSEGGIPTDMDSLADICGCPVEVIANAWQVLGRCFRLVDGCYRNDKLDSLRTERDAVRVKRKDAGRLGGLRKSLNEKESVANASHLPAGASVCHIGEERREEKNNPPNPPVGGDLLAGGKPKRKQKPKSEKTSLADWLTALGGQDAIPATDPLLIELEAAGVPDDFVALAWAVFKRDWANKTAVDWRATFRDAIRRGWIRLWYFDTTTGECRLNSTGEQSRRMLAHG